MSQIQDSIQYYEYKVEFVSDDEATITLMFSEQVMSSNRFKRVTEDAAESESSAAEETKPAEPVEASEPAVPAEKADE